MILYKTKYYNPFYVEVNNKPRFLNSINVFKDGKIVATNNRGWFGNNNNFETLEFDVDVVMKRTVDLKCKTAFIVKSDCTYDTRYDIYIPESVIELKSPTYSKSMGNTAIREEIKTSRDGVYFERYAFLDKEINVISHEISEIAKKLEFSYLSKPDEINSLVTEITKNAKAYELAYEKMINVSLDNAKDYFKEEK